MDFAKSVRNTVLKLVMTALVVLPVISCSKSNKQAAKETDQIKAIASMDELKKTIDSSGNNLLIFDLYADWCMPCKILAPTFASLAETHKSNATFFRIDVDKHPDIAAAFGVRGIPHVAFVKNKEAVHAITGVNPRESYERVILACGASKTTSSCQSELGNPL